MSFIQSVSDTRSSISSRGVVQSDPLLRATVHWKEMLLQADWFDCLFENYFFLNAYLRRHLCNRETIEKSSPHLSHASHRSGHYAVLHMLHWIQPSSSLLLIFFPWEIKRANMWEQGPKFSCSKYASLLLTFKSGHAPMFRPVSCIGFNFLGRFARKLIVKEHKDEEG